MNTRFAEADFIPRVLVAPDSFKGSLDSGSVALAMENAARQAGCDVDRCPLGDGGDGTLAVIAEALQLEIIHERVPHPLLNLAESGESIDARWGLAKDGTGYIEMAQASGLHLVPAPLRDPMHATSWGTGLLISRAIEHGCRRIVIMMGGTATCDMGLGMLQAIGMGLFGADGRPISSMFSPSALGQITRVEAPDLGDTRFEVWADVRSCLLGTDSSMLYARQKGATEAQVDELESGYRRILRVAGPGNLRVDDLMTGAAGGASFGMGFFLGASLHHGARKVMQLLNVEDRCKQADLVITGEGALDEQTRQGKCCHEILSIALGLEIDAIMVVGTCSLDDPGVPVIDLSREHGVIESMERPMDCIRQSLLDMLLRMRGRA